MDPETNKKIDQILKISKENNELLRKVRRFQKRGRMFSIFYWILIIGIPLGLYYYLRPFIEQATSLYSGSVSGIDSFFDTINSFSGSDGSINEILEQLSSTKEE